jgi:hypothetical protein
MIRWIFPGWCRRLRYHFEERDNVTSNAFTFTFIRDPFKQIASHLMWIDHYNMPEFEPEAAGLPENIRIAIQRLASTDLSSSRSIDQYLQWLPHDSDLRIINLQSELLAFKRGQAVPMSQRKLAGIAIKNLGRFNFVGISDWLPSEATTLFEMLGLGPTPIVSRLNQSPAMRKVDLSVPSIRRVLNKYIDADLSLYYHVIQTKEQLLKKGMNSGQS